MFLFDAVTGSLGLMTWTCAFLELEIPLEAGDHIICGGPWKNKAIHLSLEDLGKLKTCKPAGSAQVTIGESIGRPCNFI